MLSILFTECLRSSRHRRTHYAVSPVSNGASATVIPSVGVNVRNGPSTSNARIGGLGCGASVPVIGREGSWWKVNFNGQTGYVYAENVRVPGVVTSDNGINVRSGPGTNYARVGGVYYRQTLQITNCQNNFYFIGNGWVYADYVAVDYNQGGGGGGGGGGGSGRVNDGQMRAMGWSNYNLGDLNRCLSIFSITTSERIRHFIAQCSVESGYGKWTRELSDGSQYEYRRDLGNTQPGDGPRFKGAGYLQLTGRANYQQFANYINDQNVMSGVNYVATNYPWTSAGHYWMKRGINNLCDRGAGVEAITRVVNGGTRALNERIAAYNKARGIF